MRACCSAPGPDAPTSGAARAGNEEALVRQLTVDEADALLKRQRADLNPASVSKLISAVKAGQGGVPRIHIIDGRVEEGLLGEVFSNEGIGTLVHTNEYQAIRPAPERTPAASMASSGPVSKMKNCCPAPSRKSNVILAITSFSKWTAAWPVAWHCTPVRPKARAEMACICVAGKYENQGIGLRLMSFVEEHARGQGIKELFCLTTQAVNYFVQKGGFRLGTPDELPPSRRQRYDQSGRCSQVMIKKVEPAPR